MQLLELVDFCHFFCVYRSELSRTESELENFRKTYVELLFSIAIVPFSSYDLAMNNFCTTSSNINELIPVTGTSRIKLKTVCVFCVE